MKIFLDVMYDDTKNARKIKSCDYNNEGKYPIIDQSSKNVIGYTDEIDGLYKNVPVIIFGDHTRRFKLVEEPFFIGADGTKVLKLCSSVYDYKFIYYYLLHKKIPDTGYNRHFKWVKKLEFPEIPRSIQSDIVKKFEVLNDLISSKNKLLELFDILIKSRFVELFGDIDCNTKNWPIITLENLAELITDGEHSTPKRCNEGIYLLSARNILNHSLKLDDVDYIDEIEYSRISKRVIPKAGDILLSCSGSVGRCCVVPMEIKFQLVRSVALIRFKSEITPIFAEYMITSDWFQRQINSLKTTSSQANLFQGRIKKLKGFVPDINLQYKFVKVVNQINKLKSDVQKSIDETQLLMDSLMQEYFG